MGLNMNKQNSLEPTSGMSKQNWLETASDKIKEKMFIVANRTGEKIPYTTNQGVFDDWTNKNICWWTNGFWGGMMWQLFHATNITLYKEIAEKVEKKLDRNLMEPLGMDHDSGFKWLTTAVANYRITGNETSFKRGLIAADNLAGRFNPVGNFIRAWNDSGEGYNAGIVIIDCMMNLPLLFWAYEVTKDPRYLHIAKKHADTTIKYFIREDGSSIHIGKFDPYSGEFLESLGGQGYAVGSSWTRGQAWAVYGFTLIARHTNEEKYLEYANKIAKRFIERIPKTGLIPVDFNQPDDCSFEDSTAAAIASCGLIELYRLTKTKEYQEAAEQLLHTLYDKRCNWSEDCDQILEKCTAAYHDKEHEFSIIYGDYFFIEAIWKLTNQELFIW